MKQIFFAFILALFFCLSIFGQAQICPKTEESGGIVEAGTPMKFSVNVSGNIENLTLGYEWTVSAGTIMSGQGTCSIMVDTTGLANGTNITAEVKVKGLAECCPNTVSKTGSVIVPQFWGDSIDSFGKLPNDEVRARMDALFVALGNNPNAQGYLISYGPDKEITAREKLIKSHVAMRKYDASRIIFVRCGENPYRESEVRTVAWIVPPGAKPPGCG